MQDGELFQWSEDQARFPKCRYAMLDTLEVLFLRACSIMSLDRGVGRKG